MKNKAPLLLGSASPRRVDLLRQIGVVPGAVAAADIDETPLPLERPRELALRLAMAKNDALKTRYPGHAILTADTVVACGRRILGKPKDAAQAQEFLTLLSGRRHDVVGAIVLSCPGQMAPAARVAVTGVHMKRLSDDEITRYLQTAEWEGKAGGYAIQGFAGAFVKQLQGSYSNVVGLSLHDVYHMLNGIGCLPPLPPN